MAVEVIADMFTSSVIDPQEFENERGVILEELAMADDDPADVASERFFEAVFGDASARPADRRQPRHHQGRHPGRGVRSTTARTTGPRTSSSRWPASVDHDELVAGVERALDRGRLGPRARRRARSRDGKHWPARPHRAAPSYSCTGRSSRPTS